MNILLIGGSGFIGSNLRNYFIQKDYKVVVLDRHSNYPENYYSLPDMGWEKIIDILNADTDWTVIDLAYATVPNSSFADPVKDFSDNLYMINKCLAALEKISLRQYIYISSGGTVYGNPPLDVIDEDAPNFPLSPYGITKMACERYINMHHELYGLKNVILRPSNVYGPGQAPFRGQGLVATIFGLIYKKEPVKIFGNGDVVRDYVYIDDFCTAVEDTMHAGESGQIYNVSSASGISIMEMVKAVAPVVNEDGFSVAIDYLPERPFDVKRNVLSHKKLSSINNWQPKTSIDTGIKKTWQWVKQYMQETYR